MTLFELDLIPAGQPIALRLDDPGPADDPLRRIVAEWLIGYSSPDTRRNYRLDMDRWLNYCATSGLDPLTVRRPHLEGWLRIMEAADYSPATIARRLGSISAFYTWCVQQDHLVRNPVSGIRRPQYDPDAVKQGGLTWPQLQSLLTAAEQADHPHAPRDAFAISLMAFLGLRVGSVCKANTSDLGTYRGDRGITVPLKGGKRKFVPFNPTVAAACDRYMDYLTSSPWTRPGMLVPRDPSADRGPDRRPLFTLYGTGDRATRSSLAHALTRLAAAADLPAELVDAITPHWLRHTFVTLSLEAGTPQQHVQTAAGHASAGTTQAYDQNRHNVELHPTWRLGEIMGSLGAGERDQG